MENSSLVKLLAKIAYRMPCDEWGLTENEMQIIERASTEEIAYIIYSKGLKVATLIQNSDILIDLYNERLQKNRIRDLKNLKMYLYSDLPRAKIAKLSAPDPEEIERQILEETINEIVDDLNPNLEDSSEAFIDVEEEMIRRGLIHQTGFASINTSPRTFQNSLSNLSQLGTPSLQRHADSNLVNPANISIQDLPHSNLEMLTIDEDFGEASLDEVAQSGIFNIPLGRQIYDSYKNRKSFAEVREIVNQRRSAQSSINIPQISITNEEDLDIPSVPDIDQLVPLDQQISPIPIEKVQNQQSDLEPIIDRESGQDHSSRREMFEKLAAEAFEAQKKMKNRRKPRRNRRSLDANECIERNEFLELNGPLIFHKRKSKKGRRFRYKPEAPLRMILSIFEGLSDYEEDRVDKDEEELMEFEIDPCMRGQSLAIAPRQSIQVIRDRRSSDKYHEVKRIRLDEDIRDIIGFDENLPPPPQISIPSIEDVELSMPPPRISTLSSFHPEQTSTARKARTVNRLTTDDVEFAVLQNMSKENLNPNTAEGNSIDTIVNKLDRQKRKNETREKESDQEVRSKHTEASVVPPRLQNFVKDGEKMVLLRYDDGSPETYVEYNVETMLLYLQIRLMMKAAGRWKMKLNELMPRLKLLNSVKEIIIELRVRLLGECEFLILTFTEDEEHVDDVEIKIT